MPAADPPAAGRRWPWLLAAVLAVVLTAAVVVVATAGGDDRPAPPPSARTLAAEMARARRPDPAVPLARTRRFDADRALELVRMQLAVGQRPSGSRRLEGLRRRLLARLPEGRREPVAGHPGLYNLVGQLPGRGPAIVLAAHYDTQIEPRGFVGANDSAAGTAVVLEAARALRKLPRPITAREVRFVLLDGEELPAGGDDAHFARDGLRGSKAYAAAHARELGAVAVADYVGGRGLRLPREQQSDRALWGRIRAAAARVGVGRAFPPEDGSAIIDDHLPFLEAGVPAVDLIDWDYRYKQGTGDRLERLSARAIDAVGETLVAWLDGERRR
ncbi:M28 family metallopeptidase [Patulibacter defluvii]|uniref:M28 family metallopeptidase n=1 Tax=Patulibacter defluvii TaxID=3095358 RepID=UPI002A75851D|nr:M28 family metallopeptidase [Patulibacter sp. DM4]